MSQSVAFTVVVFILAPGIAFSACRDLPEQFFDESGKSVVLIVPSDELARSPQWSKDRDPPLSVSKATAIALFHAAIKADTRTHNLHEIRLKSVDCDGGERWYFVFQFMLSSRGGWLTFAVLFNGKVIDPEPVDAGTPNKSLERTRGT